MNDLLEIKDWILGTGPIRSSKKCYLCNELSVWVNPEEEFGYCDRHFPGRVCECEVCKNEN